MQTGTTDGWSLLIGVSRSMSGRQREQAVVVQQEPDGENHQHEQKVHDVPLEPAAAVAIDSTQCCPQVSVQSCSPSILEWTSRTSTTPKFWRPSCLQLRLSAPTTPSC